MAEGAPKQHKVVWVRPPKGALWVPARQCDEEEAPGTIVRKAHAYDAFLVRMFGTNQETYQWVRESQSAPFEPHYERLKNTSRKKDFQRAVDEALAYLEGPVEGEDKEYEVEKVLKRKIVRNEFEYLLKWKGWTDEHNTWQRESELFCEELLVDFLRRLERDPELQSHQARAKAPPIEEEIKMLTARFKRDRERDKEKEKADPEDIVDGLPKKPLKRRSRHTKKMTQGQWAKRAKGNNGAVIPKDSSELDEMEEEDEDEVQDEGERLCEVDGIERARRGPGGAMEYLIKWSQDEYSWVGEADVLWTDQDVARYKKEA